jgi:hypothetical protein
VADGYMTREYGFEEGMDESWFTIHPNGRTILDGRLDHREMEPWTGSDSRAPPRRPLWKRWMFSVPGKEYILVLGPIDQWPSHELMTARLRQEIPAGRLIPPDMQRTKADWLVELLPSKQFIIAAL